jgi:hypothetical protein
MWEFCLYWGKKLSEAAQELEPSVDLASIRQLYVMNAGFHQRCHATSRNLVTPKANFPLARMLSQTYT